MGTPPKQTTVVVSVQLPSLTLRSTTASTVVGRIRALSLATTLPEQVTQSASTALTWDITTKTASTTASVTVCTEPPTVSSTAKSTSTTTPRYSSERVVRRGPAGPPNTITIPCHHIRIGDL